MGIDPNQFDPKTYVEEKTFVTDESGAQKRIRLENNIVRWRTVKNPDGSNSVRRFLLFFFYSASSSFLTAKIQLKTFTFVFDV